MYYIMRQCFGVDTSYGSWLGLTTIASGWDVTGHHRITARGVAHVHTGDRREPFKRPMRLTSAPSAFLIFQDF
jgi:hypothetical protein